MMLLRHLILLTAFTSSAFADSARNPEVQEFIEFHCADCHGPDKQEADLRLDTKSHDFSDPDIRSRWLDAMDMINDGSMPPEEVKFRPEAGEISTIVSWIHDSSIAAERETSRGNGAVVMRRLHRSAYQNALRDLLGIPFVLPGDVSVDSLRNGFDNNGRALQMTVPELANYMLSAETALALAIPDSLSEDGGYDLRFDYDGRSLKSKRPPRSQDRTYVLPYTKHVAAGMENDPLELIKGGLAMTVDRMEKEGIYRVWIKAAHEPGDDGGPVKAVFADTRSGTRELATFTVDAPRGKPQTYETWVQLSPLKSKSANFTGIEIACGTRKRGIKFFPQSNGARLLLYASGVEGPIHDEENIARLLPRGLADDSAAHAREALENFMGRAYRRPPTSDELAVAIGIWSKAREIGLPFPSAIRKAFKFVLVSPRFLYLVEQVDAEKLAKTETLPLDAYALASRLSFFLWNSPPDQALLAAASDGSLLNRKTLLAQSRRMFQDPRADAMVTNFFAQWIGLSKFDLVAVDEQLFKSFSVDLRDSMVREPLEFFRTLIHQRLPLVNLIDSDFVVIDRQLANHYGLPADGLPPTGFHRIALPPDSHRGGLLGMGAIHTLTSNGTRTSPVHRGIWVRSVLFNDPPSPPPPTAGEIEPNIPGASKLTVRERLKKHRELPGCAACHANIDPWGLALENYDAIGAWRTKDFMEEKKIRRPEDYPDIDASAELPGGISFTGPEGLKEILNRRQGKFLEAISASLLTYATGRDPQTSDRDTVRAIANTLKAEGDTFESLVQSIVLTDEFRTK